MKTALFSFLAIAALCALTGCETTTTTTTTEETSTLRPAAVGVSETRTISTY